MPLDDNVLIACLSKRVRAGTTTNHGLDLRFGDCRLRVRVNSQELAKRLCQYFAPFLDAGLNDHPDLVIDALEMPEPDLGIDFMAWPRDPGKPGRKDSFIDLADGRACRKVKTTLQYLMSKNERLIFGPCLKNDNQVVNFIIAQYISWLINQGWVLCHASAIFRNGHGVAFAAFSGGGKSTLALHLMPEGFDFVSNDRLLVSRPGDGSARMLGVPKQPRINPGTVLTNPALSSVIGPERRAELAALPTSELWHLEEKYDAVIDSLFGPDRFRLAAPIQTFLILNWQRDSSEDTEIAPVSLRDRPDLLAAVIKSPGPFHRNPDGGYSLAGDMPNPDSYLPVLDDIQVFEATGKVDFTVARKFVLEKADG